MTKFENDADIRYQIFTDTIHFCNTASNLTLVAKSLGGTAQAPVLGHRAWNHRSGSELGPNEGASPSDTLRLSSSFAHS
jgi:hypothetical protein